MIKFKDIIKAVQDQSRVKGLTHRYYTYPAGFSPKFVSSAIENLTKKGDIVLDPFMGGGTSIVEGMRLGRKTVGVDLNYISFFVSKVKTTILKPEQRKFIEKWIIKFDKKLKNKIVLDKFTKTALSLINYKGLGKGQIHRLKLILSGCSSFLKNLKKIKDKKVNNFLRLLILRSMQSTLHNKRPICEFETFKQKIKSNCLDMLDGMNEFETNIKLNSNKKTIHNSTMYNKCASKSLTNKYLKKKKTKLIITSPPYPGINVHYGTWQIHGRRNTGLPYLILGMKHPVNRSVLNFQHPKSKSLRIYFETMEKIFSNLYKASNKKTLLMQLVAFNKIDGAFDMYLKTMKKCGFAEIKLNGKKRIWRTVPSRSWQATHAKGELSSSREVLLLHKANGKVSIN
jgi:hypothetical protein